MKWISGLIVALLSVPWPGAAAIAIDLQFTQVTGTPQVVDIRHAGDGSGRLFLVQRNSGRIHILKDGQVQATPFLDIGDRVLSSGGEQGLLSLAFAPDYPSSGLFYVWYTKLSGDMSLSRFSVSADPDLADANSEEELLEVAQPFAHHNGGRLLFGPDRMLYLSIGDGGSGGDPQGNGQSLDTLLGKIIRIDVDPALTPYGFPPDNPFVANGAARDEIWAYGLRNPWRMSFDRLTGELYIADVGQNSVEEVNHQSFGSAGGQNYGWNIMEGDQCFGGGNCSTQGLTLPVAQYLHGLGCSVTGGEVYRGGNYPGLAGVYLYGDFCSGRIWGLTRDGEAWQTGLLADAAFNIMTFGEDQAGEIYLSSGAGVYLLSDGEPVSQPPATINRGLTDAWVNANAPFQGMFITVFPDLERIFLAWFSFDSEPPPQNATAVFGAPDQRWVTALGSYQGHRADLKAELTTGGRFNASDPTAAQDTGYGTISIEFWHCNLATVEYDFPGPGLSGAFSVHRVLDDNVGLCEALSGD
jgi:glucose/arabinose dehydrogenase